MMILQNISGRRVVWTVVIVGLMLIPLSMFFINDVHWTKPVGYGIILLTLGGSYELWQWAKKRTIAYRFAFFTGLAGVFFLGWVNGAVGLIGSEDSPANLLYWAVVFVGLMGALISRLRPLGMARTLFAVAVVQLLVPVFARFIWPVQISWGGAGVMGVFIFNAVLAVLFAVSALLFRRVDAGNNG